VGQGHGRDRYADDLVLPPHGLRKLLEARTRHALHSQRIDTARARRCRVYGVITGHDLPA
jgi:hypothetical protein